MSHKNIYFSISLLAGAIASFLSIHTPTNAQSLSQGWYKVCNKQHDVDICNTMNTIVSQTGQPLTAINLVEIKGKQNEKRIGLQVPTGRLLPEGVHIQIGNDFSKKIPYVICNGTSCIANDVLDDKLISAMKAGSKMVITTVNFRGTANPIEFSLKGFTNAYTGPGIDEKAFQQEQTKLQQAIQSKQKEIEDRMRAEQEKAKQIIN
ncbi:MULTISPECIES: invasion associated locus B family protein [unclassified Bartonella]|uniref:invasion associated locus B family protein n=1 Tax=unclassified Bartonella TaxID=2645622 RepID=UPI00099AC66A|nr:MULTISPECIES: invasion associated locus B family protein [unclassified Bartonella]AQX27995.1 Invasion protein IalB, involved in pathogenesis [Bartonella sp. JB15]AQX29272.1 Invasion protein IalB, involved in pathogenesis [Bartonella sp. JB63]